MVVRVRLESTGKANSTVAKGPVVMLSVYNGRTRAPGGTSKQTPQGVEKGEGILRLVSGPPML